MIHLRMIFWAIGWTRRYMRAAWAACYIWGAEDHESALRTPRRFEFEKLDAEADQKLREYCGEGL